MILPHSDTQVHSSVFPERRVIYSIQKLQQVAVCFPAQGDPVSRKVSMNLGCVSTGGGDPSLGRLLWEGVPCFPQAQGDPHLLIPATSLYSVSRRRGVILRRTNEGDQ